MTSEELNTMKKFVISNDSFCDALKHIEDLIVDPVVKIELILYYLVINKEYLNNLNFQNKDIILSIIDNQNYIIEEDFLLSDGISIPLDYLIDLVNRIEQNKNEPSNKVIYFTNSNYNREPKLVRPQKGQIIQFREAQKNVFYTSLERAVLFERTTSINHETLPYITRTKHDFIALMNDIIIRAINDNLSGYNVKYLKVIIAYLKIFPFTVYAKGKQDVPFSSLRLPQNEIGIRKTTLKNEYIDEIEKQIALLIQRENRLLVDRERFEQDLSVSTKLLTRIEQEIISIDKEKTNYFFSLYLLRNSPEIYNENLLQYITKAFQSGTIEINRFLANPIIKLFYIKNDKTEFHSSMRLDTLLRLIPQEELLSMLEGQKVLKVEV